MSDLDRLLSGPRCTRIIDQLRRHPDLGGKWSYDRNANEWLRSDGVRVYARSHCSISEGGCESYYTRWYVAYPVHGPVCEPRSPIGTWECQAEWFSFHEGHLPDYVEVAWLWRPRR